MDILHAVTVAIVAAINALPDDVRSLSFVFSIIRLVGALAGWTVYEDGSITP